MEFFLDINDTIKSNNSKSNKVPEGEKNHDLKQNVQSESKNNITRSFSIDAVGSPTLVKGTTV